MQNWTLGKVSEQHVMDRNSWFHEQKAETERLGSHTEVQRTCTHWMGWASEHLHYLCRVELIPVEATSAKSDIDMLPWLQDRAAVPALSHRSA